jgi:hypothetical protein
MGATNQDTYIVIRKKITMEYLPKKHQLKIIGYTHVYM